MTDHPFNRSQLGTEPDPPVRPRAGILGPMRIRKKLILLHTGFSLAMGIVLLLSIQPVGSQILRDTSISATKAAIALSVDDGIDPGLGVWLERGDAEAFELRQGDIDRMMAGETVSLPAPEGSVRFGAWDVMSEQYVVANALPNDAQGIILRLYTLLTIALLAIYLAVAVALEVFVLPRHVYAPIQRLRRADQAVREGNREQELIPGSRIPSDELGEIMQSRNASITKLRDQERALTEAFARLEAIASDLKQKNELIENAQRNLADHDRLASLGVMSAGLAHEMNTPLSVLKGAVEKIVEKPNAPVPEWQSELMLRVIARLERLSDGLLDFARVRPPHSEPTDISDVVDEAWTLVQLDRSARGIEFRSVIGHEVIIPGDADRLTQVFVNLLRNSVDAMEGTGSIEIDANESDQAGRRWWSIRVANDGPRIDPEILPRLFEPFESTRLDDRGTGLGLAISEGIIREHGGFIVARNLPERGCVFEITLPSNTDEQIAVSPAFPEDLQ